MAAIVWVEIPCLIVLSSAVYLAGLQLDTSQLQTSSTSKAWVLELHQNFNF